MVRKTISVASFIAPLAFMAGYALSTIDLYPVEAAPMVNRLSIVSDRPVMPDDSAFEIGEPVGPPIPAYPIDDYILVAIETVESGGYTRLVNASEDAVGCLQIRKTVLRDLNRLGYGWTSSDRFDREKSTMMFAQYITFWANRLGLDITEPEIVSRLWNGGPRGPWKSSTDIYWDKVRSVMAD